MATLSEYGEGASVFIDVSFLDDDGAAVVPDEAKYQVDDEASGQAIVALTAVGSPLTASMTFEITPAENQMVGASKHKETRVVTIRFKYGGVAAHQGVEEYRYLLVNRGGTKL